MISAETKKFVDSHLHLIDENRFQEFYDLLLAETSEAAIFSSYDVGQLTTMIMDCGVNPLNYLKNVPGYYLAGQTTPFHTFIIPEGVESIDTRAFHLSQIEEVILPKSCTYVGYKAFSGCQLLSEVTIKNPDMDISDEAFYHCQLDTIKYNGTAHQFMRSKLMKCAELLISTEVHCTDKVICYDAQCYPEVLKPVKTRGGMINNETED